MIASIIREVMAEDFLACIRIPDVNGVSIEPERYQIFAVRGKRSRGDKVSMLQGADLPQIDDIAPGGDHGFAIRAESDAAYETCVPCQRFSGASDKPSGFLPYQPCKLIKV